MNIALILFMLVSIPEANAAGSYAFLRRDGQRGILLFKFQQGITSHIFDAMSGVPARSEGSGVRKDGPGFQCLTARGIWLCGTAMTPDGAMAADVANGSPQVNVYVDAAPGPDGLTLTFLNSRRDSASRRAVEFIYDSMSGASESVANGRRTKVGQAMTCVVVEQGPGQSSCRVTVAPDGSGAAAGLSER